MADLDAELGSRLARLAESVPIAPWLGHVQPSPVAARQRVRMAWMTPLAVLIVVALGLPVLDRAFAPGATAEPTTGIVSRTAAGPFVLELRAAKARYSPDDAIELSASLTYAGDQPTVHVSHALGPERGPIGFGSVEAVVGTHRLGTGWDTACVGTELRRGAPITIPFAKGGFVLSADEPHAAEFMGYLNDPVFRLPVGTWHLYAVAEFSLGGCGGDPVTIRTEIELQVADEDPAVVSTDAPAAAGPVVSVDTEGPYLLEFSADRRVYYESEAIDAVAAFTYLGDTGVGVGAFLPFSFSILEPVHGIEVRDQRQLIDIVCPFGHQFEPGDWSEEPFRKGGEVAADDPLLETKRAFLDDPVLRLPPGTWHLQVSSWVLRCGGGGSVDLTATIEIVVLPDPPGAMPSPSPDEAPVANVDRSNGYELRLSAESGTFRLGEWIDPLMTLTKVAETDSTLLLAPWPLVRLTITEVGGPGGTGRAPASNGCAAFGVDEVGQLHEIPFQHSPALTSWWSNAAAAAYLNRNHLVLPAGTWILRAETTLFGPTCGLQPAVELATEITITVREEGEPIWLATRDRIVTPDGRYVCMAARAGGILVRSPRTGLGLSSGTGQILDVVWPTGSSARVEAGVIVLRDGGREVGREGEWIELSGGADPSGVWLAC